MTERKPYHRTDSQKIQDEVRNKALHQDIAWRCYRATTMRELLAQQNQAIKEYENGNK